MFCKQENKSITLLKSTLSERVLSILSKRSDARCASPIVDLSTDFTSFNLENECSAEAVVTESQTYLIQTNHIWIC